MEPRFGHDFGGVRTHQEPEAAATARQLGAHAYTVGEHIVFEEGKYAPTTTAGRQLLAHELAHVVQQSGGGAAPGADGVLSRASLSVQRECAAGPCPEKALPLNAEFPLSAMAEKCLQSAYVGAHEGNTIGVNREWTTLRGQSPKEQQGLACLKPHFVGPSGMHPGEPDIWDFTATTIYEITTKSGESSRTARLANEVKLANQIAGTADCGGNVFSQGDWSPVGPCYGVGNGLFLGAKNNGAGVIVYQMMKEISEQDLSKVLRLDDYRQRLQNQFDQTSGDHRAQEQLIDKPSVTGFAGYWTNHLFNSDVPPLAIWNNASLALDMARKALQVGDIKSAVRQLIRARRAYLIAARRYWAWKAGIAGAGTKAQEAIGIVAVAAVVAFVAPTAVGALAEGATASGGVAATSETAVRIAATIAEADQAMLAADALATEQEIMAASQLEAEMELFSTLGL